MTDSPGTFQQFLLWERASRDTLEVKRTYIDMAGDFVAGVVLSQIVYWHLPNRDGQARLQVQREGKRWLAKGRADWWHECRVSPKQADRALQILETKGLIEVRLFQFGKAPTKHVRILPEGFLQGLTPHDFPMQFPIGGGHHLQAALRLLGLFALGDVRVHTHPFANPAILAE